MTAAQVTVDRVDDWVVAHLDMPERAPAPADTTAEPRPAVPATQAPAAAAPAPRPATPAPRPAAPAATPVPAQPAYTG